MKLIIKFIVQFAVAIYQINACHEYHNCRRKVAFTEGSDGTDKTCDPERLMRKLMKTVLDEKWKAWDKCVDDTIKEMPGDIPSIMDEILEDEVLSKLHNGHSLSFDDVMTQLWLAPSCLMNIDACEFFQTCLLFSHEEWKSKRLEESNVDDESFKTTAASTTVITTATTRKSNNKPPNPNNKNVNPTKRDPPKKSTTEASDTVQLVEDLTDVLMDLFNAILFINK